MNCYDLTLEYIHILDDLQRTIDKKSKASATDQGWLETDINKLEIRLFEIIDILKKKKL